MALTSISRASPPINVESNSGALYKSIRVAIRVSPIAISFAVRHATAILPRGRQPGKPVIDSARHLRRWRQHLRPQIAEQVNEGGLEGAVVFPVRAVLREHQQQAVVDLDGPVDSM